MLFFREGSAKLFEVDLYVHLNISAVRSGSVTLDVGCLIVTHKSIISQSCQHPAIKHRFTETGFTVFTPSGGIKNKTTFPDLNSGLCSLDFDPLLQRALRNRKTTYIVSF